MRITKINYGERIYQRDLNNTKNNELSNKNSTVQNQMVTLPNYGYGRDLVNKKQINFTGANDIRKAAETLLQQFPLEDRLATLFQSLKFGDVIVVGKDFNKAQEALKKSVQKVSQVIKRETFMKEDSLNQNYAFIKNALGDTELLNINDKKLTLITGGKNYSLDPGTSFYVVNHDTVQMGNDVIHIKDKPKHDLTTMSKVFAQTFDYTKEVQDELAKLNQKTISKRIQQSTKPIGKITFDKIGGQDKAIDELKKSILFPIKYPAAYAPEDVTRGFIIHGPAGTGKTAICRALANEAGVNSAYISGTAFQSKWVGESEGNVRAFFEGLKENQPSIGIIDEIDAIGNTRGNGDHYSDKLIDQLLTSITDLYENGDNVYIIGLTNRYDTLDPALKRAERLSKHILMDTPDKDGVRKIFDIHTQNKSLDSDVNVEELVDKLHGMKAVGGDILYVTKLARENMMNRLGIYEKMNAGTFNEDEIKTAKLTHSDFLSAIEQFKTQNKGNSRVQIGFNHNK